MQKVLLLFIFFLTISTTIHSQSTTPVDYHNPLFRNGQKSTAYRFMKFLENGEIDSALRLIDTSFITAKKKYKDSLTLYYKELSKYFKTTQLSVVIVYPEHKYNTYRCRYYSEKGDFFYIDLYYKVSQPNSRIAKNLEEARKRINSRKKRISYPF
jgi:hypothetical protein